MMLKFIILAAFMVLSVNCDCYLHNCRGSNNRLNEATATRTTNNRIFDSQNNNRGGYNVGDRTDGRAGGNYANQYRMQYFMSSPIAESKLFIEWTMQHGCGGNEDDNPHKLNCNNVIQYMCQPDRGADTRHSRLTNAEKTAIIVTQVRDGTSTTQNRYDGPKTTETAWKNAYRTQNRVDRGMHEPYHWYDKCSARDRNQGLFTADQNLQGTASKYTRQNANGGRSGYECPEERDYYPYWHPTDWKDIAVYAQNASLCEYYQSESFNVKPKWECVENWPGTNRKKHFSKHNNKAECEQNGGEWLEFHNFLEKATDVKTQDDCEAKNYTWGRPIYSYEKECLVPLSKPDCAEAPWTRVNHLGNGAKGDLQTSGYVWNLPYFPSKQKQRCVLRVRYNISTDDYDPYKTDSSGNGDGVISGNPQVDIGAAGVKLQLNINTAQFGRTFQDRSHVFKLLPRPRHTDDRIIYNINVRGKRGNIVQTFPAVEYDFSPTNITITDQDLVHIQWTGSNSHNNGGNGGDGQTGDAGEGRGGTDRNNVLGMADPNHNFPVFAESDQNIFNNIQKVHWTQTVEDLNDCDYEFSGTDVYVQYASAGYYACAQCNSAHSLKNKRLMDADMDNAPASYRGMLLQLKGGKTYYYMCTRNNNFTNRSQKAVVIVESTS